jgi:hypothetical protein
MALCALLFLALAVNELRNLLAPYLSFI